MFDEAIPNMVSEQEHRLTKQTYYSGDELL